MKNPVYEYIKLFDNLRQLSSSSLHHRNRSLPQRFPFSRGISLLAAERRRWKFRGRFSGSRSAGKSRQRANGARILSSRSDKRDANMLARFAERSRYRREENRVRIRKSRGLPTAAEPPGRADDKVD